MPTWWRCSAMSDDENTPKKGFMFFGRDVSEIPCFRESFLYGISGGLVAGFAYFMFTSRVKRACDVGVYSFVTITAVYWMQCRYRWTEQRIQYRRMQAELREYMAKEGTENSESESLTKPTKPSHPEFVSV